VDVEAVVEAHQVDEVPTDLMRTLLGCHLRWDITILTPNIPNIALKFQEEEVVHTAGIQLIPVHPFLSGVIPTHNRLDLNSIISNKVVPAEEVVALLDEESHEEGTKVVPEEVLLRTPLLHLE